MAHDVFLSYSSKDKRFADAVCATLEAHDIPCWIAPRDILPGMDYGGAIIDGIEQSRVMVLVFSSSANVSPQIKREVERAANKDLPIVLLRIEDQQPGHNLEFFLSAQHWFDAITPPFEQHLNHILEVVSLLLEGANQSPYTPPDPPIVRFWQHAAAIGLAVLALCVIAEGYG